MTHRFSRTAILGAVVLVALSGGGAAAQPPAPAGPVSTSKVCGTATPGATAVCLAVVRTDHDTHPFATTGPNGLGAGDLQSAYALPSGTAGSGHTVAIVDAFDDPTAESDLATYRQQYGLPPCTTANGCFRKVDQRGGSDYPTPDFGWAVEISLDLDMASAVCPKCSILLVESDDNSFDNLAIAVDEAATLGATEISNSYGAPEFPGETDLDGHYHHPGVAITAASGDFAYGVSYPASAPNVTAVGGTTLVRAGNERGWAEHAWDGAGSGCSAYVDKPTWQDDKLCGMRTVADISAVADPNTGVAVFDSFQILNGWVVVGGTSVASPLIAGIYALAGPHPSIDGAAGLYRNSAAFNDVVRGANGQCGNYLCTATNHYDGPTGLGSPAGTGGLR